MSAAAAPCHQRLPDELLEEIFARMPAKSVLRCRCVSRAWAAALSADAFVDRHLHLASRRRRFPSLCFLPGSANDASTVYAWSPEHGKAGVFMPLMAVPHNARNGTFAAVTRPCRGLLLVRYVAARLYYLCNPSIGQITALPDGRMAGHRCPGRDYASFGLGYDARTRTHKVVRLLYHDSRPAGCDIYDMGAASTGHWRPAAGGAAPPERVRMNQMGVFVQGHVHWVTMTRSRDGEAIVTFSTAGEEFGHITPLPVRVELDIRLTELAGCLCLLSAPHSPQSPLKSISIWLLTDYTARAWEKHCHIDLAKLPPAPEVGDDFMFNGVTPLALIDGGRRVLFVSEQYQVAAYCLATGTLEELVRGFRGRGHLGAQGQLLVPYEESLVPAGRPFEDILFSPPPARALSMVLRRLPARTLGRLKLVCRSWRAMIESDRFVASHNACARETAAASSTVPVVFVHPYGTTASVPVEFLELLSSPVVSLESCSGGDCGAGRQNPPPSTSRVVCRKPCHGLLLLSHESSNVCALCNPVTREVGYFVFSGEAHGCAGLGYDRSREEHVLVRLLYTPQPCFETREYTMECQVWPLRDLAPRTLPSRPPIPVAVDVPPVHVGGRMYWPGEPPLCAARGAPVLAFDICAETFEVVPMPPVLLDVGSGDRMVLAELAGKLCAVHMSRSTETVTVWGKNGGGEGWTMDHVMQLGRWPEFSPRSAELVVPIAVDPGDGRVLLDTGKALGYYDLWNRSLETVYSLGGHHGADDKFFIATLSEDSLFRPYDRKCRLW